MAVFIEFLAGSGLAIFFHLVLHNGQAAYTLFGIGILLSLVTYLVRDDIEKTKTTMLEQYHQAHEIPFALARITDTECQAKAQELLASTRRTITLLQQGYIPLDESEFYLEGAKLSDQSVHQVKAVDPLTSGWLTRGVLLNYYQANLRALGRGVRIVRVFVTTRSELDDPEAQKVLLAQHRDGIDIRIAFRDELPAASDISGRDTISSCDFAIYDDRTVADVFVQSGKYYGRKTSQPAEVGRYLHLYDLIEHSGHAVSVENDRVVPSAEAATSSS